MFLEIIVLIEIFRSFAICELVIDNKKCVKALDVPYVASVQRVVNTDPKSSNHWCMGCIVQPHAILIPAHCVLKRVLPQSAPVHSDLVTMPYDPSELVVITGATSLSNDKDPKGGFQKRDVEEIIVHEMYSPNLMGFDVALIKLTVSLVMDIKTQTIVLPSPEMLHNMNSWDFYREDLCFAARWGKSMEDSVHSLCVQAENIVPLNESSCGDALTKADPKRGMETNEMCVATQRKTLCQESASELLVCTCYIIGIGVEVFCKDDLFIATFSSVVKYYDWISYKAGKEPEKEPSEGSRQASFASRRRLCRFLLICKLLTAMIN